MTTQEQINQQLNHLNQDQLNQVADFITFLKFREKLIQAKLYQEFAEEDRQLAEVGMNEYADLLTKEDQL